MPFIKHAYDLRDYKDLEAFQRVAQQSGYNDGRKTIPSVAPSEEELWAQARKKLAALQELSEVTASETGPLEAYYPRYKIGWEQGRREAEQEQQRAEEPPAVWNYETKQWDEIDQKFLKQEGEN